MLIGPTPRFLYLKMKSLRLLSTLVSLFYSLQFGFFYFTYIIFCVFLQFQDNFVSCKIMTLNRGESAAWGTRGVHSGGEITKTEQERVLSLGAYNLSFLVFQGWNKGTGPYHKNWLWDSNRLSCSMHIYLRMCQVSTVICTYLVRMLNQFITKSFVTSGANKIFVT